MVIKTYLSTIILLLSVCFVQSQNTAFESSVTSEMTSITSVSTKATSAVTGATSVPTTATSAVTGATSVSTTATSAVTGATSVPTTATSAVTGATSVPTTATSAVTGATSVSTTATSAVTGATSVPTTATSAVTGATSVPTTATSAVTGATSVSTAATSAVTGATSVSTNATSAVTGATSVSTNTTSVLTNVTSVLTNVTSVSTNATSAVTGATSVSTNTTSVLTNVTSVSTDATSAVTSTSATVTTTSIATNINVTFKYAIQSDFGLRTGIINDANVTQNVQMLVSNSYNVSGVDRRILQIEISSNSSIAKAAGSFYNLLVYILLTNHRTDCNITCITSASAPTINISLPLTNGSLVQVYTVSVAPQVDVITTADVTYPKGGPSPGIPAQLGMGLGISLIGVLLIVEIIFFVRKHGLSNPPRRDQYAMSSYE